MQAADASLLTQRARLWLGLSLASAFLLGGCCFGLVGAAFQLLAIQSIQQGSLHDAQEKVYWGRIITIAGTVMQVFLLVVATLYVLRGRTHP